MFELFPAELKALPQWINWAYETRTDGKPTKVPVNPHNGLRASSTDPTTWGTFDAVCANVAHHAGLGAGFVFTRAAGFTGIDLDNVRSPDHATLHGRVYEVMRSYSEWSPSGEGLHIIVRGTVPVGKANRLNGIEMYCEGRFFTVTGNALNPVAPTDAQAELDSLFSLLGGMPNEIVAVSQDQSLDDDEILKRAWNAANAEIFQPLWTGANIRDGKFAGNGRYPSQSEADQALINILQFYSKNAEQVERLFKRSGLAQTLSRKPNPDYYVRHSVKRAFDRELPPVDLSGVAAAVARIKMKEAAKEAATREQPAAPSPVEPAAAPIAPAEPSTPATGHGNPFSERPPGLIGDISDFVMQQAPYPVRELANAAALALMAAICGRTFNVSGSGLNLYLLALAPTGTGKEAMHSGIGKLVHAMIAGGTVFASKLIGPGQISSMPALMKHLADAPNCVSIIGEWGKRMAKISNDDRVQQNDRDLASLILNLYNKSGINDTTDSIVYSDRVKNLPAIASPAFTILGESAPGPFYDNIDSSVIDGGLLPRFTVIEVETRWIEANRAADQALPTKELVLRLRQLAGFCAGCDAGQPRQYVPIKFSQEADAMSAEFQRNCRIKAFKQSETVTAMWTRAHVKAMRFAALCAIGRVEAMNALPSTTIEAQDMAWAIWLAEYDVNAILLKIMRGAMMDKTSNQYGVMQVCKAVKSYITNGKELNSYQINRRAQELNIIDQTYLMQRLGSSMPFSKDPNAFKRCVQMMIDQDILQPIDANDIRRSSIRSLRATLYQISDVDKLDTLLFA